MTPGSFNVRIPSNGLWCRHRVYFGKHLFESGSGKISCLKSSQNPSAMSTSSKSELDAIALLGDELLEVVNRVKIDALHLVEMRLEIQRLVVAEPHGTEKTGQIFLLVGRRINANSDGADHS